MNYKKHKRKWIDCDRCDLCQTRTKVVFGKGKLPCDILFVGEAPGRAEDVLGRAFVGPAGHELDYEIETAITKCGLQNPPDLAFTNLVGCIPLDEINKKNNAPPKESIKTCRERLFEFIDLASPSAVIACGDLPHKELNKIRGGHDILSEVRIFKITHPARILRADISQQGLMRQKNIIVIQDVIEELLNDSE